MKKFEALVEFKIAGVLDNSTSIETLLDQYIFKIEPKSPITKTMWPYGGDPPILNGGQICKDVEYVRVFRVLEE